MRKVRFRKWHPSRYVETNGANKLRDAQWSGFIYDGLFHQWANAVEETHTGFVNYTVALVEVPGGEIEQVLPSSIMFEPEVQNGQA